MKFLSYCLITLLFTACWHGKSMLSDKTSRNQQIVVLAWNEDTVSSYKFVLTQDNKFAYTIIRNDSIKSETHYSGIATSHHLSDIIFLQYKSDEHPPAAKPYLINEMSGSYLIQPFVNNAKSVFMRKQRLGHRL